MPPNNTDANSAFHVTTPYIAPGKPFMAAYMKRSDGVTIRKRRPKPYYTQFDGICPDPQRVRFEVELDEYMRPKEPAKVKTYPRYGYSVWEFLWSAKLDTVLLPVRLLAAWQITACIIDFRYLDEVFYDVWPNIWMAVLCCLSVVDHARELIQPDRVFSVATSWETSWKYIPYYFLFFFIHSYAVAMVPVVFISLIKVSHFFHKARHPFHEGKLGSKLDVSVLAEMILLPASVIALTQEGTLCFMPFLYCASFRYWTWWHMSAEQLSLARRFFRNRARRFFHNRERFFPTPLEEFCDGY